MLASERADRAMDRRARKLRCDAPLVVVGVSSWSVPVAEINKEPEKLKRYEEWRDETIAWLARRWSDDLKTVVQHLDEAYPHIHFIVVPKLSVDRRLRIASIHPGHGAAEQTERAGGEGRDQKKAYREAMESLQDDYYEQASVKFGQLRIGPRLQRLTRAEWSEKKRQADALAEAHVAVQLFASNIKAISKDFIATRTLETNQAALAKIDHIKAQSDEHFARLKQKAATHISGLKSRLTELEWLLSEKDDVIAAQAAEIEVVINLLREHGLSPNREM